MAILIGSARHDENGNLTGGKVGDQKQKIASDGLDHSGEVSVQNFYTHKKGWVILRAKDGNLALGLAFCMAVACNNANIGYDQTNRLGAYKYGVNTKTKTETDCSGLVRACIKQCGHDVPNFTTANEASVLVNSGLFEKKTYSKQSDLCNGDILVTKTSGHTVIILSGAKARTVKEQNPYAEPTNTLKKGSQGNGVKWLQWELNESGANLTIDGDFGNNTLTALKAFQSCHYDEKGKLLTVDGVCGSKTRLALKSV